MDSREVQLFVRRPVLALVCSLLILIFGGVGFRALGVREYPAVDPPVVTVTTNYVGASPDVVDSQITEILEQAINGIAGIRTLSSTSRDGQSQIRVEFAIGTDLENATNDVRDKVSGAVRRLPVNADPPIVEKASADADPIVFLTLKSDRRDILEVSNAADTVVKERVQTIPGVSSVRIFGEKRYAMRLYLDADKMAAYRVTPQDVQLAVNRENVDAPSGRIEGAATELGLRTAGRLGTPQEFNRMIIKRENGRQITLRDVGRAELDAENQRAGLKQNGVPMIGVALIPQPNTNAIEIADEFYHRLEAIRRELPPDYQVDVGYDFTVFVRRSVREVEETLFIAFGLVAGVIFLFLRDWRATLVPVLAIPVSIVSAFFVMYVAGFSINVLTLVGLVLAIGLVCDDAIVVLENVYAKIEAGMTPLDATVRGTREITFAVLSTTITLCVVFLPVMFLQGLTGRLFREFGGVVVGSVLVSAFVALSLSPMMCRYVLERRARPNLLQRVTEPFFAALTRGYARSLAFFMRARWLVFPVMGAVVAATLHFGGKLRSELAPNEDRSNIRITVRAPEGASFDYVDASLDRLATWITDRVPELTRTFSITGFGGSANVALQNVYLVEPDRRVRTQAQVFQDLSGALAGFSELRAFPAEPPTIGGRMAGLPVQYVLQAANVDELGKVLGPFIEEANRSPVLRFVDADLKINRPEGLVAVDREKAAELGVPVSDVAATLDAAYGGRRFGYFIKNGRQYQIIAQFDRQDRDEPSDLERLFVRARSNDFVSLANVVGLDERVSPAALYRYDRYMAATVSAGLAPGYTIGDGIQAMDEIAKRTLPPTMRTSLAGQSRDFVDSASSLGFAFGMALVLIFLVLAAQFESFRDPFVILFTVPLSLAGAVLSLWLFDQTLNVFSQIGIIMLIGLVTKNGILIVEFANQRHDHGLGLKEAVVDAAAARFRPILMTTLATLLGVLPIALSFGAAAGSRQGLGIAVVGGLSLSTLLTLYVVPVMYGYVASERRRETPTVAQPPSGHGTAASQASTES